MARVGVIICHCGANIAAMVEIKQLEQAALGMPGVVFATDCKHSCSGQGQEIISRAIKEQKLDRLVIAACSPKMHEATFRRLLEQSGLNPYMLEIANIREQCSWVHTDKQMATDKAIDLLRMAVARVQKSRPLYASAVSLHKKCLVVGGGIAGVQAALDIAAAGFEVTLCEREPSLGGKMAMLDKTFPTLDCAACILEPKIAELAAHPLIRVLTSCRISAIKGYVGNFQVQLEQKGLINDDFGAILLATGYDLIDWRPYYPEYGGGRYANIISGLQFEGLLNAAGPSEGRIIKPGDGLSPQTVVIIKCAGSRDPARAKGYCSRVCCMYGAKHARQILEKIPAARVYVFYLDMRAAGKDYEEFYNESRELGAIYIRGRVAKIYEEDGKLICMAEDTLLGRALTVEADLVILETAMEPAKGLAELAALLGVTVDQEGWLKEAHPKLRPVESRVPGIFMAGAAQGPKDIADTVAQASAAAAKVLGLFAQEQLRISPLISAVEQMKCSGCGYCAKICPHQAISLMEQPPASGGQSRLFAQVNGALCSGCGLCAAACRSGAIDLAGYSNPQILGEVAALW